MAEIAIQIGFIVTIFLAPLILGIGTLRQVIGKSARSIWAIVATVAVLANWTLLIVWCFVAPRYFGRVHLTTVIADLFVLCSLLLVVGSLVLSVARWKLCVASLILLSLWIAAEQRQFMRDNGSMLSVSISRAADKVGCPGGGYAAAILHKMANYDMRGHYDAAISAGDAWIQANPKDGFNDWIFIRIAWDYLQKAQHDTTHADDYVSEALRYRNKALPDALDTPVGWYNLGVVRDLALISSVAGDLSVKRRCTQYQNAINLLERRTTMLGDKRDQISRRFVTDKEDLTVDDVKHFSEETQTAMEQVRAKQQSHGCS